MAVSDTRIWTDQEGNQWEFDNGQNFMDNSGRVIIKLKKAKRGHGKKIVKQYLNQDKESGWELAEELGFEEGTPEFDEVRGWAYEIPIDLEVDLDTGKTRIVMVNGEAVSYPAQDAKRKVL